MQVQCAQMLQLEARTKRHQQRAQQPPGGIARLQDLEQTQCKENQRPEIYGNNIQLVEQQQNADDDQCPAVHHRGIHSAFRFTHGGLLQRTPRGDHLPMRLGRPL